MIPPFEPGDTVFSIANIGTQTCYTYDSTTHSCTTANGQGKYFTGAKELETFTIPSNGKYKITVKGEAGRVQENHGGVCGSGGGGYNCPWFSAAGGTNVVEKGLTKNTALKFIAIAGTPNPDRVAVTSGSGVGLFLDGSLFMVAGGGYSAGYGGGGYLGGCNTAGYTGCGYSWDGSQTSFNMTYAEGANGGAGTWSSNSCGVLVYGGSGYCADNTCVSTYGTAANVGTSPCFSTNSNGLPRGPGYANVVYCGPNSSSTCP